MSATVRAVRARFELHDRRVGRFPMPLRRYAPRPWWPVHPWGYYVLRHVSLYRRGPLRVRLHRRPVNAHAVAHALYIAAWGTHVCSTVHVSTIGPVQGGKTPAAALRVVTDGPTLTVVKP